MELIDPSLGLDSKPRRRRKAPTQKPRSKTSETMRKKWQDPEFRARQEKVFAARRADPNKSWTRRGIPDGLTRARAAPLWAEAKAKARETLEALKAAGFI